MKRYNPEISHGPSNVAYMKECENGEYVKADESLAGNDRRYIPVMLSGLSRCIETAFVHSESFLDEFWPKWREGGIEGLHECYMASERTKIVVMREDGGFITQAISTQDFICWVERTLNGIKQ
ncbi:hypothetical protein [Kordiimonas sp.]|uniref:hypothetical protein n=1 Tax=Kordiimonas sp. TaxID=1970157 RepID=UPI003A8D2F4C